MVTSNIASDHLVAPRGALAPGKSHDMIFTYPMGIQYSLAGMAHSIHNEYNYKPKNHPAEHMWFLSVSL